MTSPHIRPATPADLDAIMLIEHAAFGSTAWPRDSMASELAASEHRHYFVASDGDALLGYAGISVVAGHQSNVMTIAVTESSRGRGIGRALMQKLVDVAVAQKSVEIFLEVRADNPAAQGLYRSMGFEQIDLRRGYYKPENIDAVIMLKTIDLVAQPTSIQPLVLGIESSCDETGIGIVRGTTLLANVISSSMDQHARFGGVVPEIAARAHLEALPQPSVQPAHQPFPRACVPSHCASHRRLPIVPPTLLLRVPEGAREARGAGLLAQPRVSSRLLLLQERADLRTPRAAPVPVRSPMWVPNLLAVPSGPTVRAV